MYTPNLVSILFYDQPLSIFKFDDIMPTSRILRARVKHSDQGCNAGLLDAKQEPKRTSIHGRKTTKIIGLVSREMAVNDLVCEDINVSW